MYNLKNTKIDFVFALFDRVNSTIGAISPGTTSLEITLNEVVFVFMNCSRALNQSLAVRSFTVSTRRVSLTSIMSTATGNPWFAVVEAEIATVLVFASKKILGSIPQPGTQSRTVSTINHTRIPGG